MSINSIDCRIITLSDRASAGSYSDESSRVIARYAEELAAKETYNCKIGFDLLPDDATLLEEKIIYYTHTSPVDVIFTTGGTGIGPRDITPDTIAPMLERTLPGVMELVRVKYGLTNPKAMLSRSIAGIIKKTLVFTLPGSPKAAAEYCEVIMPLLKHAIEMLHGDNSSHGNTHPNPAKIQ